MLQYQQLAMRYITRSRAGDPIKDQIWIQVNAVSFAATGISVTQAC
jgi:hypothetical protein